MIDPRKQAIFESGTLPVVANALAAQKKAELNGEDDEFHTRAYNTSTWHQIKILCHRNVLKTMKDRRATVTATARHILVALFYGSIYYQLGGGHDPSNYTNRLGLFFFSLMFMTIGHQQQIPAQLDDRLIFYRERGAKAYGALSYWISCWAIPVPLIFGNVLLFSIILYNMSGLNSHSSDNFGYYYFIMLLSSISGNLIASFVASISPSTQAALSYYPIVLFFSVSFAGFLVYLPQFPEWIGDWAPYISFMRYAFQGLTLNEFHHNGDLPDSGSYISQLGFDTLSKTDCASILFFWMLFYGFIFLLALKYINFEER